MLSAEAPLLLKYSVPGKAARAYRQTLRRVQPLFHGNRHGFSAFRDRVKFLIRENPEDSSAETLAEQIDTLGSAMAQCLVPVEVTSDRLRVHLTKEMAADTDRLEIKPPSQSAVARSAAFFLRLLTQRPGPGPAEIVPPGSFEKALAKTRLAAAEKRNAEAAAAAAAAAGRGRQSRGIDLKPNCSSGAPPSVTAARGFAAYSDAAEGSVRQRLDAAVAARRQQALQQELARAETEG